jgi:hypothetical protein
MELALNASPSANPPRKPKHVSEEGYARALRASFIAHALFILLVLFKGLIFPSAPKPYVPTLRVDMVGLPDVLKKDLRALPTDTSVADPDELVLHPKKKSLTNQSREKKLRSALDRIKALSKITADDTPKSKTILVKGNKISKGAALSGDAKEAAEASYYDLLRGKLQENWALPVWIARQNYSAQVQLFVDGRGRVKSFRFVKTSGNAQFDSAIKKTLEESQPFPAPSEDVAGSLLTNGVLIGFPL